MKTWWVTICLILATTTAFAAIPSQTLMKGQATTIDSDYDIGDVAVVDPSICDYLVGQDRRSIYLNARSGGDTTITIWDTQGAKRDEFQIRVVTTTLKEILDRMHAEFGDLSGVNVEVKGGHVEIGGEVKEPEDFRRIDGMAKRDPRLRNRVRLSQDMIGQVVGTIQNAMDVPGVTVRSVRDRIVLEGVAYSPADAKRASEIAKLYSPDVLDLIEVKETGRVVGRGRMIELSFHMMEVKRSALRQFGINWAPGSFPGSGNGTGGGAGLLSGIAGIGQELIGFVMNLVPKIKFAREQGDGRVLENPSVVVKSGEEAKVFSGSEVPYFRGQEVQFKKVGIEISAVPIETPRGVDIKLSATLSAPTADLRGSIDTHTISTTAICPQGTSLVLGNVVRNGDVKMKNRVPHGVDTSTALFTLFLSKDFQSNRSEFVVFVTPRMVDQPAPAEAELREFLVMEESMIRDRSKKEFSEYASNHIGTAGVDTAIDKNTEGRRPRKKKWR